jgi:CRP-like cAMP-binding protein
MVKPADLESVPLFRGLPAGAREMLCSVAAFRDYRAGETVFAEGEPTGTLHVLVEGLVSLRERTRSGEHDVAMGRIEPGDVFGVSALLGEGNSYTSTAHCLEDSRTIELDGERLLRACEDLPKAGVHVLRALTSVLAQRLRGARDQIRSRVRPGLISHG